MVSVLRSATSGPTACLRSNQQVLLRTRHNSLGLRSVVHSFRVRMAIWQATCVVMAAISLKLLFFHRCKSRESFWRAGRSWGLGADKEVNGRTCSPILLMGQCANVCETEGLHATTSQHFRAFDKNETKKMSASIQRVNQRKSIRTLHNQSGRAYITGSGRGGRRVSINPCIFGSPVEYKLRGLLHLGPRTQYEFLHAAKLWHFSAFW